jgi:isopenicillin-N N-acyltransferase-like protein
MVAGIAGRDARARPVPPQEVITMRRVSVVVVCLVLAVAASGALAAGYRTAVGSGADEVPVVVVSGTPYEMGYSYGSLMRSEVASCMDRYLAAAKAEDAARYSDQALDAAWATVEPYVDSRFIQEMHGVADGAGVSYDFIKRAHSISLLGDYSCSGVALWGAASADGHLYQIRNLDYTTDAGLQDYPVIVVYIPKTGIAHANPAFAGFVGGIAGMNAKGIALTEKGATPGSDYPFDLDGIPFFVMFRDILQDAATLDDALAIVTNADRIKKYYYVIGDGRRRAGVKIRAFAPNLDIWRDNDPTDEVAPKVMPDLVYITMDDDAAWNHFNAHYGHYNAALMIELSRLVASDGGNLMNVVYDATARQMWVAYAEGPVQASQRAYAPFKLNDYLRKPPNAAP